MYLYKKAAEWRTPEVAAYKAQQRQTRESRLNGQARDAATIDSIRTMGEDWTNKHMLPNGTIYVGRDEAREMARDPDGKGEWRNGIYYPYGMSHGYTANELGMGTRSGGARDRRGFYETTLEYPEGGPPLPGTKEFDSWYQTEIVAKRPAGRMQSTTDKSERRAEAKQGQSPQWSRIVTTLMTPQSTSARSSAAVPRPMATNAYSGDGTAPAIIPDEQQVNPPGKLNDYKMRIG